MEVSQLRIYSIGIVAANKVLSSKDIEVTPIEDLPMTDGELLDNVDQYSAAASTVDGAAYQVNVATANTVTATWLPINGSNRMTAPDVRRGETVVLYRFGDTDKFYWATLKDDMRLRKLETVVFAFSATRNENQDTTAETSYFIEISTHKKLIHLHTASADGEPFEYDIQLNTKDGYFVITDNAGNSFTLDSHRKQLQLENGAGSVLNILDKQIFMSSPDLIDMQTTRMTVKAETLDITAETTHRGNITELGNFALAGNFSMGGAGGGSATAEIQGSMKVTEDVTASDVSLAHHKHPGDSGGVTDTPIPG